MASDLFQSKVCIFIPKGHIYMMLKGVCVCVFVCVCVGGGGGVRPHVHACVGVCVAKSRTQVNVVNIQLRFFGVELIYYVIVKPLLIFFS